MHQFKIYYGSIQVKKTHLISKILVVNCHKFRRYMPVKQDQVVDEATVLLLQSHLNFLFLYYYFLLPLYSMNWFSVKNELINSKIYVFLPSMLLKFDY